MTPELSTSFEKPFANGPCIRADLRGPAMGFHITVLFGPSGCGKTTILRCLAGLERPQRGFICFGDEVWFDATAGLHRSPQERGIGYLFQDYALFPHLTIFDNIAYGLSALPRVERRQRASEMMARFGLQGLGERLPHRISGGQQQRVARARALACRPRLLLLDEPLSALDAPLREELRAVLRHLLTEYDLPVVMVTHDQAEATALADAVVEMR